MPGPLDEQTADAFHTSETSHLHALRADLAAARVQPISHSCAIFLPFAPAILARALSRPASLHVEVEAEVGMVQRCTRRPSHSTRPTEKRAHVLIKLDSIHSRGTRIQYSISVYLSLTSSSSNRRGT